ncbi:hypothetical protein AN401_11645 [Zobellella denitrificans]|uniref:Uncharacterized protein n=1 Tax=Zobellella denitrificans TaxID=347534 RepID=A0A291HQC0_9GAMM|nr:hypothetical protein [Zobellella denitrificans]ATG74426.1 hypothetical protein AN401_11645 [Zobellella denitrificans]
MEPLSLIATATGIARLATEHGPGLLRSVGQLLGGKAQATADTIATLTEQVGNVAGISPGDRTKALANVIQGLPAEHQVELARIHAQAESEALRLEVDRELARLQDRQAEHEQTQATIRGGDQASDELVRETRPLLARRSFWLTALYCLAAEAARLGGLAEEGAEIAVASLLAAPCWAYIGLRTLDGFAPYPKSSGQKLPGVLGAIAKGVSR